MAQVRRDPAGAESWLRLGRRYLDAGDVVAARLCGERALALAPGSPHGLALAAAGARTDRGSAAATRDECERALASGAAHPHLSVTLALAHLAGGEDARAALHLRSALRALPHDIRVRRTLRTALARQSLLYRILSMPRLAALWLRGRLGKGVLGSLPLVEIASLTILMLAIMHNPFDERRPVVILFALGGMAGWWPLVATLEVLASRRLRSDEIPAGSAQAARDALAAGGPLGAALTSIAAVALGLLWRPMHEWQVAAFCVVFVVTNTVLLGGGYLVAEIARHIRATRRRRRVAELLAISR